MPELPEVETVRRGLAELLPSKTVKKVSVFNSPKSSPIIPKRLMSFFMALKLPM